MGDVRRSTNTDVPSDKPADDMPQALRRTVARDLGHDTPKSAPRASAPPSPPSIVSSPDRLPDKFSLKGEDRSDSIVVKSDNEALPPLPPSPAKEDQEESIRRPKIVLPAGTSELIDAEKPPIEGAKKDNSATPDREPGHDVMLPSACGTKEALDWPVPRSPSTDSSNESAKSEIWNCNDHTTSSRQPSVSHRPSEARSSKSRPLRPHRSTASPTFTEPKDEKPKKKWWQRTCCFGTRT